MKILGSLLITVLVVHVAFATQTQSGAATSAQTSSAQTKASEYPNAKVQANELSEAVLAGKYERAADLTYPRLVELMGGRARYVEVMSHAMNQTQSDAFSILSNVVADPQQTIVQGKNVFAILPTTMKIKVPEGLLVGQSFMIGASTDGGKNWTFVDGAGANPQQLAILFPTVAGKLNLPEKKRPVLQQGP
jgi:hypothetical protein